MLFKITMPSGSPNWGGRRKGAGRPRTRPHPGLVGPGVPHLARPEITVRSKAQVSVSLRPGHLRSRRSAKLVDEAVKDASGRFGLRILRHSIEGNTLHLTVEADTTKALSRAMQGLGIRLAKRLNALGGRSGAVFVDRYRVKNL
jgi:hypothetical protein